MSPAVALLYVSEIETPSPQIVEAIRTQSESNNARDGITDLLLFDGRLAVVMAALLERLMRDDRHQNIQVLSYDDVDERIFPGWRLGFAYVADAQTPRPKSTVLTSPRPRPILSTANPSTHRSTPGEDR